MKERSKVRPGLPPDARAEILEALCSNMEISSDEIRNIPHNELEKKAVLLASGIKS